MCQEEKIHMYTQEVSNNKGYYLCPDTYLGIVSKPSHPGYIVKWVDPPCENPLWCDYIQLSDSYICLTIQERLFCMPSAYFLEQDHIIFVGLFLRIFNLLPCSPKDEFDIWLYSTLKEAEFNETIFVVTSTCLGNTHIYMTTSCILSVINSNNKMWC